MKTKRKTTPSISGARAGKKKPPAVPAPALQIENILERVSDGFAAFDARMNYAYVNQKGGELLGRKPEDLIGKNYWVEYPEAKGTPFAKACVRALETQTSIEFEDYYQPFERWFENRIYPSKDGLSIFFHEITGRKRAELGLLQAGKKYHDIFENAVEGIFQSTPQGRFITVNPAMARIYGYASPEEMIASITEINRQVYSDLKMRQDFTSQLASKGFVENFENRNLRKDGSVFWTKTNARAVRDGSGKILYYEGFVTDITEGKRAEEKLRLSEDRFSRAFFASPAGMTITRIADGKFMDVNDSFCSMFEFHRDEVVGHTSTELNMWTPEERKRLIQHQLESGGLRDFELQARSKSGRVVFILFSSKPMELEGEPCLITTMIDITERKQAEEKIAYQANLLANVNDAVIASDENFALTSWNHSAERIYGWRAEEVIGKSGAEILQTEFLTISRPEAIKQLIESGEYLAEVINSRKDGAKIYIETRATALRDPNGKTAGYVSVNRDITERKHAEEALRESEERLRLSTELANVAVWDYDFIANSMSRSKNHDKLYGLDWQDKWDINVFLSAIHPDDRAYSNEMIQQAAAPGGPDQYTFDFRVVYPDQTIHWLNVIGQVVERNPEGQGVIVRGTLINITERIRAEEALRESEERYRLLVNESPYAIGVHQDGKIVFANPSALRLFGAKNEEELIGKPILELIRPETRAAARERIGRMLRGETGLYPTEDHYLQLNGTVVPVEVTAAPFTHAGRPAVQVIALDITERKQAEDELRLSRDRLAELSRRLVEAHETEQRAIGRELHDQIGQMLTALKLTIEVAMQMPPDQALQKAAQGRALIVELMNRVSALSLELRPPMLDDLGLIPALLWHVNRYQEQTGIQVDFKHSGAEGMRFDPEIETTAYRIVQESLTNIARHARAAHARVEVRAGSEEMEIRLEDDGAGFDPQAAFALNRGLGGMRERVTLLGGSFEIESEKGGGTRKLIRLPLQENQA